MKGGDKTVDAYEEVGSHKETEDRELLKGRIKSGYASPRHVRPSPSWSSTGPVFFFSSVSLEGMDGFRAFFFAAALRAFAFSSHSPCSMSFM